MAEPNATVYVVDDEADMLKALERLLGAAGLMSAYPFPAFAQKTTTKPLLVAAVVTEYRILSHADVILTKILEGWHHDGKDCIFHDDDHWQQRVRRSTATSFPVHLECADG